MLNNDPFPSEEDADPVEDLTPPGTRLVVREEGGARYDENEDDEDGDPFRDPRNDGSSSVGPELKFHTTPSWVIDQAERNKRR
jgi:hypothetical protein